MSSGNTVLETQTANSILLLCPWEVCALSSSQPPGSCWWKSRSQTVFYSTLQCPQPHWSPREVQGVLSHSALWFTRPGHEVGDGPGGPCTVQREAVRRGPLRFLLHRSHCASVKGASLSSLRLMASSRTSSIDKIN